MSRQVHTVKVVVGAHGYADVLLDGERILNLTEATVRVTRDGVRVELILQDVEVEVTGDLSLVKTTTRTDEYEGRER